MEAAAVMSWLSPVAIIVLALGGPLYALSRIKRSSLGDQSRAAWQLVVILVPFIGSLLYLLWLTWERGQKLP